VGVSYVDGNGVGLSRRREGVLGDKGGGREDGVSLTPRVGKR
jgi:hypothetical protein